MSAKCRLCGKQTLTHPLHTPCQSRINLSIVSCNNCNLVQGICNETAYASENDDFKDPKLILSTISCDSPYSNIRVGKQQMAEKFFRIAEDLPIDFSIINSVLDVRFARGSFLLKAPSLFPNATRFVGFEQDLYLHPAKTCISDARIELLDNSVYNAPSNIGSFDFIYSCHTLEHYRDPVKYIKSIRKMLSVNGYLFIDVPNLIDFVDHETLDDFFYDKHLLYFTPKTLARLLISNGFAIKWSRTDGNGCIELLAQLNDSQADDIITIDHYPDIDSSRVSEYSYRLAANRNLLPSISRKIESTAIDLGAPFVAFGAGRILDAFVRYGNLDTRIFHSFVDNYLSQASRIVNNLELACLEEINVKDAVFILFTRVKSKALVELILSQHISATVYHWTEFDASI
jgi:SAM-dependent methyltransferase